MAHEGEWMGEVKHTVVPGLGTLPPHFLRRSWRRGGDVGDGYNVPERATTSSAALLTFPEEDSEFGPAFRVYTGQLPSSSQGK